MNRKDFLKTALAAGCGMAVIPSLVSCSVSAPVFEPLKMAAGSLKQVRGNVYRYTNKGGTVGIFETKEGFMIVDSQFPDSIQPVLEAVSSKGKPVEILANTHHHGDHTSGNISFKSLTRKIVAHKRVPDLQRKAATEKKSLDQQLYANILFSESHTMHIGNQTVTGYHFGNGHTFGDAVYHFENDNVVHMGDLMFINMIPVYRISDGSDSFNWITVLEKIIDKFDDDTQFIFGHADKPENATGTKERLREMKNFLKASNDFVSSKMLAGISTEDILKTNAFIPGFENRTTPQRFPDFLKGIRETISKNQ